MRPCLFCKCTNATVVYDLEDYYVQCDGCGATGPHAKWRSDAELLWDGELPPERIFRPKEYI